MAGAVVKPWHEKPRTEWTPHDWLYAAAAELLKHAAENPYESMAPASGIIMDFADENCRQQSSTRARFDDVTGEVRAR